MHNRVEVARITSSILLSVTLAGAFESSALAQALPAPAPPPAQPAPTPAATAAPATTATAITEPAPPAATTTPSDATAGYNVPIAQGGASPEDHARVDNSPFAHDGHPLAGYHNGLFFLRDHHDNFHLYVQGRVQLDGYGYIGPGVTKTNLKPTLFIRRIRPEVSGEFLGHWRFMLAGDFGATAIDNPRNTPTTTTSRYPPTETVRFQAAPTDAFINYRNGSAFNVMVGQMDAPFTMENRTSDKYLPFAERSLAVRAVGIPTNKEIGAMFWGETSDRLIYYSVGPYMGDGQNRPNVDSRFDVFGRAFIHPLAKTSMLAKGNPLRDAQIGAGFHYGSRDKDWVFYDYTPMTTQASYAFWTPTYAGSKGTMHIIPNGDQRAVAGELRLPIGNFDVTSEFVYIRNNTREAVEGYEATNTERFGNIHGIAYYVMLGFWPLGNRDINGVPGYGNPPRLDWSVSDPVIPRQALQLLAKWEQVALTYQSSSRDGLPDGPRNADGDIKVNAFSFGANYWATRHVRLTLNYVHDMFPGSAPVNPTTPDGPAQSSRNRALAPANTLRTGLDDSARNHSHSLNEIITRIAIAL